MRERTITVDINKNYHKSLNYKQYDNNNVLNIIIKEDDNLVDITNYTARAFYQLPSKTVIQRNTTKNGKNTIKLKIDKVILAESGRISLEVVINNVDTVVTTFTLFIDVEKSIDRNEAIEGYPEWDIIADGLSHLDDVENRMSIAENEIVDIESEVSTVKNRVSTVEGEVADIESEVTNARDGETSLKSRLDRDIEKAKQVYVNVEGSHISTNSSSGYAKDVEILGNTIQDASNLADIRSVGDTVEGQELYEIPVLSCGKNLFDGELEPGTYQYNNGVKVSSTTEIRSVHKIKVNPNSNYIISTNKPVGNIGVYYYDSKENFIKAVYDDGQKVVTTEDTHFIAFRFVSLDLDRTVQIEEGTVATPYEPYQEDKLTILSPVQLEKVGDVRDRIICKDGVWGVEKNIVEKLIDGSQTFANNGTPQDEFKTYYIPDFFDYTMSSAISDSFICKRQLDFGTRCIFTIADTKNLFICISDNELGSLSINEWVKYNNILVKYPTTQPTFIPLAHDQQIKLRTFANKTNISFGCEIEGMIKAQVPKSIGATVNTHTEQINNLNKELDRVKKLEESTVSTVTTESEFTTVEATSNGYFEDVKLEGKTLVNLANFKYSNTTDSRISWGVNECKIVDSEVTLVNMSNKTLGIDILNLENEFVSYMDVQAGSAIAYTLTSSTKVGNLIGSFDYGWTTDDLQALKQALIVLEGDHTQNPPSYFEGLKSVGQSATTSETDEIVVSSVNKNLFSGNILLGRYDETGNFVNDNRMYTTSKFKIQANKTIVVNHNDINTIWINFWDVNMNHISQVQVHPYNSITTPINCVICSITGSIGATLNNLQVEYGTIATPYTPHQSDKKRLLYYNEETQTWEKPILRQWDSIEKHSDGKYYYHQRSGEVVLNGSESWVEDKSFDNTVGFYLQNFGITTNYIFCKEFKYSPQSDFGFKDEECISCNNNAIKIRITKSKLSTPNVEGFKQWLQANNVTVVYQLAQEKIYECTNIDLITYANETNYVVESGAIIPKTTLKVMSNISNTVRELQRKVSTLESYIQYVMIDALNNALNE